MPTLAKTCISHKCWETEVFLGASIVCQTNRYSLHVTFVGTRNGRNCPESECWLELLKWPHFLTVTKNGSMNLLLAM
jgi:hypothetical protein